MKKSELRQIIKEEIQKQQLNEDIVTTLLNYIDTIITQGRAANIKKEVDAEFKKRLDRLEANRGDLEKYIKGNMSKEEVLALYNKIKR